MNPDLIANVFKSGYNRSSTNFKQTKIFPYELNNFQKNVQNFNVKKVFDSEKQRWKGKGDISQNSYLDIEVLYSFSINEIKFNTGLNEDFMAALESASAEKSFELIQPIVADYELNYRQLVLYMVDCETIKCDQQTMEFFASQLTIDTPFNIIWDKPGQGSTINLANEIKTSLLNLL